MRLIREHYLQLLRPYYETDLIKVITGVRRAGKSILLECIRDELIQRGVHTDHIIFMNLEDLDYEYIQTASDLHVDIKARINDSGKYYIFLDEIQHIEHFEKALASFRASLNVSIFVTGSNSTLLSGDLSTLLTGRAVEFEVLPFSFSAVSYTHLDVYKRQIQHSSKVSTVSCVLSGASDRVSAMLCNPRIFLSV